MTTKDETINNHKPYKTSFCRENNHQNNGANLGICKEGQKGRIYRRHQIFKGRDSSVVPTEHLIHIRQGGAP